MNEFESEYFEQDASYSRRGGYSAMLVDVRRFYQEYFRIAATMAPDIARGDGKRALEVGCALGVGVQLLSDWHYDVYGTDISAYAIDEARQRYAADGHFAVADAQQPNPFGLRFDFVAAVHVVEHLPDGSAAISALAEATREGGHLLVATPNPASISPYRRFQRDPTHVNEQPPEVWKSMLEHAGLHVVGCKTFHIVPVLHRWTGVRYAAMPRWLGYDTVIVARRTALE